MNKLALIGLVLLISGCAQQEMGDLQKYVADVKARPPTPIEPIPQIRQAETFLYVANSRRDPFSILQAGEGEKEVASVGGPVPDFNRRKEELENYPLDSLAMVGTLEQRNEDWGLVKTKDGTIHRVKPGNYLGQNYGQIQSISEDHIEIKELVQDSKGGYIERLASLVLGEREQKEKP